MESAERRTTTDKLSTESSPESPSKILLKDSDIERENKRAKLESSPDAIVGPSFNLNQSKGLHEMFSSEESSVGIKLEADAEMNATLPYSSNPYMGVSVGEGDGTQFTLSDDKSTTKVNMGCSVKLCLLVLGVFRIGEYTVMWSPLFDSVFT